MAIYSAAIPLEPYVSGTPICEIRNVGTVLSFITEIGLSLQGITGTAISIGFGRPAASGVTPNKVFTPQADDPGSPTSKVIVATSWTTPPTVPTNFQRRITSNPVTSNIPMPLILSFPRGFSIIPGNSLVLWCVAAGASYATGDVWLQIDSGG